MRAQSTSTINRWWHILVLLCMLFAHTQLTRAQADSAAQAVTQLNRIRLENGLPPLSISGLLERAAQRHSDDQQRGNFLDDTGSDGSTGKDRLLREGYGAWQGGRTIWGETLYVSTAGFQEVLDFILNDPIQRGLLLNNRYREIGVGVAGTDRQYWTLHYAAQPNVLPAFINDGSGVTNNANVAVRLTQEDALPEGEGNSTIGRVIEARISSDATMRTVAWQPWQALLEFKFDLKPGLKTIYVQYRDAVGRTVTSAASIRYDPNAANTIKPIGPGAVQTELPATTAAPAAIAAPSAPPTASVSPTPAPTLRPGAPLPTSTAVTIGNAPPTQPAPTAALAAPTAIVVPTAFVYSVDESQRTPGAADAAGSSVSVAMETPSASPDASAEATPVPPFSRAAIQQSLASPLMGWLLPIYGVLQTLFIIVAVVFFIRKASAKS